MNVEKVSPATQAAAAIAVPIGTAEKVKPGGQYEVEYLDASGNLVWQDTIDNLVTTLGKNSLLDNHLSGSGYTAAWYLGLVDGGSAPSFNAADTAASHAGWSEFTGYDNATRPAPAFNAAAAGSKATTSTSFSINASGTVSGCLLISDNTKGGATGVLYSCGAFTGGDQPVTAGGTLNVTYTASA